MSASQHKSAADGNIRLWGITTHNLKNLDLSIAKGQITAVMGVSGSGKSSLVFATLYGAAFQRFLAIQALRFVHKFGGGQASKASSGPSSSSGSSSRLPQPKLQGSANLPAAIALRQHLPFFPQKATVGSYSEIYPVLRRLIVSEGQRFCPSCGEPLRRYSPYDVSQVLTSAAAQGDDEQGKPAQAIFAAPLSLSEQSGVSIARLAKELMAAGFSRYLKVLPEAKAKTKTKAKQEPEGESFELGKLSQLIEEGQEALFEQSDGEQSGGFAVVVDKTSLSAANSHRIEEAASLAYRMSAGELLVTTKATTDGKIQRFYNELSCLSCQQRWPALGVNHYNPSTAEGQCSRCSGLGQLVASDAHADVLDWWQKLRPQLGLPATILKQVEKASGMQAGAVNNGEPESCCSFEQTVGALLAEDDSFETEALLKSSLVFTDCEDCSGSGVSPESLATELFGISFGDWLALSIGTLHDQLIAHGKELEAKPPGLIELITATDTLASLRLGYLSLSEPARQLSGGEVQRIGLAKVLSSDLHDCLICLDEPSACLHPADVQTVFARIKSLAALGNTVVVVDHHPLVQTIADHCLFVGPFGGSEGGRFVTGLPSFEPPQMVPLPAHAEDQDGSGGNTLRLTEINCRYFKNAELQLPLPAQPKGTGGAGRWKKIGPRITGSKENQALGSKGHRSHEGLMVGIAGVSGSGKSTLVKDVLIACLGGGSNLPAKLSLPYKVVPKFLSQKALGRSSRSTLLTYLGLAAPLRKAFAAHPEARRRGYTPQHFNRHHKLGACERCGGSGIDPSMSYGEGAAEQRPCRSCGGHGFKKSILDIKHLELSIVDISQLTLTDALTAFAEDDSAINIQVVEALTPLETFGLGYLTLGQSTSSYSGGQAQRLRLARLMRDVAHVSGRGSAKGSAQEAGEPLVILDEPSLGLSPYDVAGLIRQFQAMCAEGITVIIVEHNLDILRCCQWLVELGPGAGPKGSQIIYQGPRERHPGGTPLGGFL